MLTAIQGIYRDGKIQLSEVPENVTNDTRVIVTFLSPDSKDLKAMGLDESKAADLRARLATFADDWEHPDMDVYDNYDAENGDV